MEEDSSFDTMATDGQVIKYNPDFVLGLPMEEIKGVLIHEALHVVWGHHLRRGDRHRSFGTLLLIMQSMAMKFIAWETVASRCIAFA